MLNCVKMILAYKKRKEDLMITIQQMITHIMNPSSNILLLSDSCMIDTDENIQKILETKLDKVFTSMRKKKAKFIEESPIQIMLEAYQQKENTFIKISTNIAQRIFDAKMKAGLYEDFDFIMAEVLYEERRYIVGFENTYHEGITHRVEQEDDQVNNEIITAKAMLSTAFSKKDAAFSIELSDLDIYLMEETIDIEGEKQPLYETYILKCSSALSYEQGTKALVKTCNELAKKYDLDEVSIIPKMKKIVKENVESSNDIKLDEIADILFDEQPIIKKEFREELQRKGFTKDISVEHMRTAKSEKVQKLRTDNGIEIIIPIDFMNSKDYVEFSNAADGTISIRLKNINKLMSK